MLTPEEHETHRAQVAREEWIGWRMMDVPAIYRSLMPVSCDATMLYQAERSIRLMLKADVEDVNTNIWQRLGASPKSVDWENLSGQDKIAIGSVSMKFAGMPDAFKPGVIPSEALKNPELNALHEAGKKQLDRERAARDAKLRQENSDAANPESASRTVG